MNFPRLSQAQFSLCQNGAFPVVVDRGCLRCLFHSNKLKRRIFHLKYQRHFAIFSMTTLCCEDVKRCWGTQDLPFLQAPMSGGVSKQGVIGCLSHCTARPVEMRSFPPSSYRDRKNEQNMMAAERKAGKAEGNAKVEVQEKTY